jgi:hypothetical protein
MSVGASMLSPPCCLFPAGKLRPIAEQLSRMSAEDRAMYRLPEDALGAIHFRAVERIYGDSVGSLHHRS